MFSKKVALVSGIFLPLMVMFSACNKVGEQPPEQKALELTATKCLDRSAEDLKNFFDGSVDDARLALAWTCVQSAFTTFEKYVVGQQKDRYTSAEIVAFLESYFFEDAESKKISPELQKELMKLKQIFLGGDTDYVTRDELRRSPEFFQQLSQMTVKLNPHMGVIVRNWKPQIDTVKSKDLETFEQANIAFQEFSSGVAALVLKNKSIYQISDIVILCQEFEKFFNADWSWVDDLEKLVPAAKKLKIALAGGSEDTINEKEWSSVLTLGARGYFQFLRYHYFIKSTYETGGAVRLVYVARTLEDVFSIFQDLVSQKTSGVVTAKEVYDILKCFEEFWSAFKVSEKLISEFMKLKQVLIGGSTETWTAVDFEQARLKVPELRRIIENFMPYFSVYSSEWEPEMEDPDSARGTFDQAKTRLAVVAQDLGQFFAGAYSFDDFIQLVTEINALYPHISTQGFLNKTMSQVLDAPTEGQNSKNFAEQIAQYRGVFLEVKKMVYNEPDTIIQKDQWAQVLPLIAQMFSIYQYYDYFLTDKNWKQTQAIEDLGALVEYSVSFGRSLFQVTSKGHFTQDELESLTAELAKTDILKAPLTAQTNKKFWTAVLQHLLFSPERRLAGEKNTRMSLEQLHIIQYEFIVWMKTQIALNDLFQNDLQKSLTPAELLKALKDAIKEQGDDPQLKVGLEDLYTALDSTLTATWDSEDRLEISNRVAWSYKLNATFQTNISRALARLLMRSFAKHPSLRRIDKCEAQEAFDLLVGFFREMDIFDPQDNFIDSRFLEANLFMGRGNGDKFIEFYELTDLFNIIFSGLRMHESLESSIRIHCPVYKTKEGKEFVTFKCMSEHHYVMVRKQMTHLPELKLYIEKLAEKDKAQSPIMKDPDAIHSADRSQQQGRARAGFAAWNKVFKQTLKATGWIPNKGYSQVKEESVLFDDALYYPFIIQYTELLFARFDYTKNARLQSFEAKKAFPVFRPLLRELADDQIRKGLLDEDDMLSLFTFILHYKVEPSLNTLFKWLGWKGNESKWEKELWVDRGDAADILGYIADKTRESDSDDEAPVCKTR